MTRSLVLVAALAGLSGCNRRTVESGLKVLVTFEPSTTSRCVEVVARGGRVEHRTTRIAIEGKVQLVIGIAQGDLPDEISLEAVGYEGATCADETRPGERAPPVSAKFLVNKVATASLRLVHTDAEAQCSNGLDDNGDGTVDCADDDCAGAPCSTGNVCVVGQVCADRVCSNGAQVLCDAPPSECFEPSGLCIQGPDGGCRYGIRAGVPCDPKDLCVTPGACSGTGQCIGAPVTCTQAANQCLATSGTCDRDAGCRYAPRTNQTCSDGDNCTLADRCDDDGGCQGTRVSCPETECASFTGQCTSDGGCGYAMFDAGAGCDGGLCNGAGGCIPPFPYAPSNFELTQVPTPPTQAVVLDCGETVITTRASGAPTVSNWCGQPAFGWANLTQDGGPNAVLISFTSLDVGADAGLRIVGERPAIIVATRDVRVFGWISAESGAQACQGAGAGGNGTALASIGGGGGGAFGGAGAPGGNGAAIGQGLGGAAGVVNGEPLLVPLRGGCPGGNGSGGAPEAGGGALQISAGQYVIVSGVGAIGAPGHGGAGGQLAAPSTGGKGGGSGGAILLEALQLQFVGNAAVTANGGGGGKGGGLVEGGVSGASGSLVSAVPAAGGSGLGLGGNGGDGGTASSAPTPGDNGTAAGGGGGGGVGRLRLNSVLSCSVGVGVVFSPAPVSSPDSGCP